jgi:hypothetical protein
MANVKISELPAATSAGIGDELAANQSGTTRKLTRAQIIDGLAASGAVTGSGLTMATARVLGRTTASTGAVEELSAGTGITLSAGSIAVTSGTYQAQDAELTAIAGLTSAADMLPYFTGSGTAALATFTGAGRALVDDADAAAQRTTLGLGTAATMTGPSGTIVGTTDTQTLTNKTFTGYTETVFAITDGAAFEINPANGTIQTITLGASRTPKATNFVAGQSVTLMVNDGTAYTLTWTDATFGTGGVIWVGGTAPTLATTGFTVIEFWKVGSQVYGALVGSVA